MFSSLLQVDYRAVFEHVVLNEIPHSFRHPLFEIGLLLTKRMSGSDEHTPYAAGTPSTICCFVFSQNYLAIALSLKRHSADMAITSRTTCSMLCLAHDRLFV